MNKKINDGINRILEMNDELLKSLGNLILLNDIFSNNNFPENINYLSLLQRKRRLENSYLNSNNNFSFQKEINLGMPNIDNFQINNDKRRYGHFPIEQNNSQIEPILNVSDFQGNNTEFEIKNNCSNFSNSGNNNLKDVFVNDDTNSNKNFISENNLNFNNNNINNSINNIIINDEKEKNFINSTNSLSDSNNSYLEENGNKKKVFKNNKKVYMNSYWIYN